MSRQFSVSRIFSLVFLVSLQWSCNLGAITFVKKNAKSESWPIATTSGSCADGCNYDASRDCQCNSACDNYNDCCDDFEHYCASCETFGCGTYESGKVCQCNSQCDNYDDCCDDYQDYCDSHNATQCPNPPAIAGDRRSDKTRLRIMEYNMDWLFTSYHHSMGSLECPGDCDWSSDTVAVAHQNAEAEYVANINPDMLFIEEVEDCWELHQLIESMPDIDGIAATEIYKPYLLLGGDTYTGQNCGLITKIDPITILSRSDEYISYPLSDSNCGYQGSGGSSGCTKHFYTSFNIDGIENPVTMIGVHFLSNPTASTSCAKREAQATVISNIIENEINNGNEILVTGDFNDYADDVLDSNNNIPTSHVTKIIRESGNLINAVSLIQDQNEIYSDWYDRDGSCIDTGGDEHSLIDQFYVSQGLYNKITDVQIDHSYENGCDCMYSDHWPIIVDFDLSSNNNNDNDEKSTIISDDEDRSSTLK